jgi:hypothetical protein
MPSVTQPWVAKAREEVKVQGEARIKGDRITVAYPTQFDGSHK